MAVPKLDAIVFMEGSVYIVGSKHSQNPKPSSSLGLTIQPYVSERKHWMVIVLGVPWTYG